MIKRGCFHVVQLVVLAITTGVLISQPVLGPAVSQITGTTKDQSGAIGAGS